MNREVEREILIKVLSKYSSESRCERHGNPFGDDYCKGCKYESEKSCEDSNRADYLLENGMIVPPCKMGTTIYMIVEKRASVTREYFRFIKKTKLTFLNLERVLKCFGKTVFLTREEAKQALVNYESSKSDNKRKENE